MSAALQAVLADVAARQPLVHELAMYASLAARIEAPLLRRLRQQLLPPEADPGLEADLWFSPLVESFDADACVLHPWIAEQLRATLPPSGKLRQVWAIVGVAHAAAPPWQRLEEEVAYLSLSGAGAKAAEALRGALKAMVASPERGVQVARWAMHALPRLPREAAAWPEARALEQGMHARIAVLGAAPRWGDTPVFDHGRDGWVLPAVAATTTPGAVAIGLRVDGDALLVCDAAEVAAEARLQLPDSRTRRLQVRSTDATGRVRYAALRGRPGQRVVFEAAPTDIEITTEAGVVHGLEAVVEANANADADAARLSTAPAARSIDDCRYPLFICASSRDHEWVDFFRAALDEQLRGLIGRPREAPMSFWDTSDLIAGETFHAAIDAAIEDSYAFLLIVSEASLQSTYCSHEFEAFVRSAGQDGLRERLHVVAMSGSAIRQWKADPFWRERIGDHLWSPFFEPTQPDRPLAASEEFNVRLARLAQQLVRQLQLDTRPEPALAEAAPSAPAQPRVQIGVVALELDGPTASLRRRLRVDLGLEAHSCNREALHGEFPEFAAADLLLLPFNDSQPMMSTVAVGGHLALQRDAWLRHGKPADALLWVDMRSVPPGLPLIEEHAAFIADIEAASLKPQAVLARLGTKTPAPANEPDPLRIFIEYDKGEPFRWRRLDESLRRRWALLQREQPAYPPPALRSLRLPTDSVDRLAPLVDADALVFVWTHQTAEEMQSRIEQAERLLADPVPGLVVCLSPPHDLDRWPQPLAGCTTLRFDASDARALNVVADDADRLDRFLLAAMAHRRSAGASPPA